MNMRIVVAVLSLLLLSAISISGVSAHHSYLLTVQQLRAGLNKAPSMPQKGFILIDVRSAEEHATGFIPGTDLNIDFREIQARHRDIGAQLEDRLLPVRPSQQHCGRNAGRFGLSPCLQRHR
jgi:hypothetical protein